MFDYTFLTNIFSQFAGIKRPVAAVDAVPLVLELSPRPSCLRMYRIKVGE